jgi:hypothetical protein
MSIAATGEMDNAVACKFTREHGRRRGCCRGSSRRRRYSAIDAVRVQSPRQTVVFHHASLPVATRFHNFRELGLAGSLVKSPDTTIFHVDRYYRLHCRV